MAQQTPKCSIKTEKTESKYCIGNIELVILISNNEFHVVFTENFTAIISVYSDLISNLDNVHDTQLKSVYRP